MIHLTQTSLTELALSLRPLITFPWQGLVWRPLAVAFHRDGERSAFLRGFRLPWRQQPSHCALRTLSPFFKSRWPDVRLSPLLAGRRQNSHAAACDFLRSSCTLPHAAGLDASRPDYKKAFDDILLLFDAEKSRQEVVLAGPRKNAKDLVSLWAMPDPP